MSQPDIAAQHDSAARIMPDIFVPAGQVQETAPGGLAITLSSETLKWADLTYRDRTFVFSRELLIRVTQEEGGWAFDSDDPELFGFGHTRSEAEQSFCFDFSSCWSDIACEEDSKLAPDAVELKQTLLGLVKAQSD